MTNKIIATQYISLDGVIQDPVGMENSGLGDWTGPYTRGPLGDQFKLAELRSAEAVLLGRVTYDAFAAVWPTVDDPEGFGRRMNSLPKFVPSRTLQQASWTNTTLLKGDLIEDVGTLRSTAKGDILIYGSASIVHQLMPQGLIDEYRLMVYPVVLGRGTKLFPEKVSQKFSLLEQQPFSDGILLLRYGNA